MENTLAIQIQKIGLEAETQAVIVNKFNPFIEQVKGWQEKAKAIEVTSANQVREMKMAREARLALKSLRVDADKMRKALKEDSNRYGKAVQSLYNFIEESISPIEDYLFKQENFVEIQEANRKSELASQRQQELSPYWEFVVQPIALGELSEEEYQKLFNGSKLQHEAKIRAEEELKEKQRKAAMRSQTLQIRMHKIGHVWSFVSDEDKAILADMEEGVFDDVLNNAVKKQELYVAEQKRIQEENERVRQEHLQKEKERLEKEAEERKKQMEAERIKREAEAKEREKIEAKAQAEKVAREKAERELRELKERELREQREKEEQQEALAKAPDKTKLFALAKAIEDFRIEAVPSMKSKAGKQIVKDADELLRKVSAYVHGKADKM